MKTSTESDNEVIDCESLILSSKGGGSIDIIMFSIVPNKFIFIG